MESDLSISVLPPVLSTRDVAELLNVHVRTVLAMAKDGRLPAHHLPGSRRVQFLTAEILETLGGTSFGEPAGAQGAQAPAVVPRAPSVEADPCDVWGAAPAQCGEDWAERCLAHWIDLAREAGLSPIGVTSAHLPTMAGRDSVGAVEIDGLVYEVRTGPRQRTRFVDDDGEVRWGLIDAVWAEPRSQTGPPSETPSGSRGDLAT